MAEAKLFAWTFLPKMHFRFITQVGGETALTNDDVDFLLNAIGASDQDDISIDQIFKTLTTE